MSAKLLSTKSLVQRILAVLGGIILLYVLATAFSCLYLHERGLYELARIRHDLAADGTLLPIAQIVPPPSEDALARGEKYAIAISGLSELRKKVTFPQEQPSLMRLVSPGIASSTAHELAPLFDSVSRTTPPKSWEDLQGQVETAAQTLATVRQILREPVALKHDYASFGPEDSINQSQLLVAWLRADALIRLHHDDLAGAIDDLALIRQVANYVSGSRAVIFNVLGLGLWNYGARDLIWEILQSPSLTDDDLARLGHIFSEDDFIKEAVQSIEVEAFIVPERYRQISEFPLSTPGSPFTLNSSSFLGNKFVVPIWRNLWLAAWASADQALALSNWGASIRLARELQIRKDWPAVEAALGNASRSFPAHDAWKFPVARIFTGSDEAHGFLHAAVNAETKRQLILTAIALQRYHLKNVRYPNSLEELVPDYLSSLPIDWFNGQPLKYRLLTEGQYLLYSVGENGTDDGGDASAKDKSAKVSFDKGRDLVWPRPQK